MSAPIVVTIPGEPRGKGAPRFRHITTKDGRSFNMAFKDAKTENYMGVVKSMAMVAMVGQLPLECPVHVTIIIRCVPALSWPAWKREAALNGLIVPDGKPDPDNVKKAVFDGLTGVVWRDDVQNVRGAWVKEYHEQAAVIVQIRPMTAVASSRITRKDQLPNAARIALERQMILDEPEVLEGAAP